MSNNLVASEEQAMPRFMVIVGNVGSVYQGDSRAAAEHAFESYVQGSRSLKAARCYGEDVTLFMRGEIERHHFGHVRGT